VRETHRIFCVPHAPTKMWKVTSASPFRTLLQALTRDNIYIIHVTDYWGHNRIHAVNYFANWVTAAAVAWRGRIRRRENNGPLVVTSAELIFTSTQTMTERWSRDECDRVREKWIRERRRKSFLCASGSGGDNEGRVTPPWCANSFLVRFALISRVSEETGNPLLRAREVSMTNILVVELSTILLTWRYSFWN
jgi:hypothetical protein